MKIRSKEDLEKKYKVDWPSVLEIFIDDLKEIKGNVAVLVIIVGLLIVPSLYAWFNIKAFWDPYSNAKYLKVAVVNQDAGAVFKEQKLDLGQKVVDSLKENRALDWQFVNKQKAEQGLKSGKYYAIILLPKNFTKDLLSLTEKNVHKATIDYSVNEKVNAIAPKITDRGATALQMKVNENLVETVSKVSLLALGGVSNLIGDINPKLDEMRKILENLDKQLDNMQKLSDSSSKSMDALQSSLKTGKSTIANVKATVSDSKKLSSDLRKLVNESNESFNNLVPDLKKDVNMVADVFSQVDDLASNAASNISITSGDAVLLLQRADSKLVNGITLLDSIINVLKRINIYNSNLLNMGIEQLQSYLDMANRLNRLLTDATNSLQSGGELSSSLASSISNLANQLNRRSLDIVNNFDSKIRNPINNMTKSGNDVFDDVNKIMDRADRLYPDFDRLLTNAMTVTSDLKNTKTMTDTSISLLKNQVKDSLEAIKSLQDNSEFQNFNRIIKANILDRVDFIKDPVKINEHKVYPIKNYGSAMAPFYSVLACWVGALVLVAILSTKTRKEYRTVDVYFGRMMLFMMLAIIQALIIGFGDFFIIDITAERPGVFALILVYCSIVFTAIIYSLVSIFGTVGKGISVFLLVIQIGGSGGTFPVAMTPVFFRAINAIIPFTYGIDACREAVGGIYGPNLVKDVIALLIFMVIPIITAKVFKEPLNKLGHPMHEKFTDSFLIGH